MNSIPFNYGYCNIQFDWRHMPSYNVESVNLMVGSESKVEYKEVASEKENVNNTIIKKIKGYRVNLDLILYSYYLNSGVNYGWQRIINYQFRNNNIGDTHVTGITGWNRPGARAADLIIEADDTYQKCLTVSDLGAAAYKYTYQQIRTLCAEKTYRLYYYVKGASGTYKVKLKAWSDSGSEEEFKTGVLDGNWSLLQSLDITVLSTISGDTPNVLQVLLESTSTGGAVSYANPRLMEKTTGNQHDLLEFLYYYRRCNTFDKRFYIYPYVGGNNFWNTDARAKIKFIVIPEKIEVLDIISRNKKLGQKIHLTARTKDLISREDLNYLIYRDIDTDNLYIEPYSKIYVPSSRVSQGLVDRFYIEKNT